MFITCTELDWIKHYKTLCNNSSLSEKGSIYSSISMFAQSLTQHGPGPWPGPLGAIAIQIITRILGLTTLV